MDEAITRDPQTFAILGAAFEIRRHLGSGYLEAIYRSAIRVEFGLRDIPYEAEPDLTVSYKTRLLGRFSPDFLCFGDVIVEIKAQPALSGRDIAQTLNYLRASPASRALLINFGSARVEFKRLVGESWKTSSTE